MSHRRIVTVWSILGLLLVLQGRVGAAPLVAPEQIPSDALVVLSVSDAPALWDNVKKSPLYGSVNNLLNLPAVKNDPQFQSFFSDLQAAQKRIGIPLDPENFFTKVLVGGDFALSIRSEATEEPDILMVLKFKDPKVVGLFLKEMEADANTASGTPTPAATAAPQASPALPKATYQTIAGQQVLVIPAEGLWACQKNDLLILASAAAMMNKSLTTNAATGFDKSPFIREGLAALGNPSRAQLFYYLDYAGILKAMSASKPELQASMKPMESLLSVKFVGVGNVYPDHIDFQAYSPGSPEDPLEKALAEKYPPSDLQIARLIPADSMLSFAINSFDGPTILDGIADQLAAMSSSMAPAGPGAKPKDEFKQKFDEEVKNIDTTLGFKLKDDLLASIGPEASFDVENFAINPLAGPYPSLDLTIAFQVRDKAKLQMVLGKLEAYLTQQLPAMMGGGMQESPGQQGQKPMVTMRDVTLDGAKGKILTMPQMPNYAIGWIWVDNYIVVGTTENALKHAAQAYAGTLPSMIASPDYAKLKSFFPQRCNSMAMIGVRPIVELIYNVVMAFSPQSVQGEQGAVFNAAVDVAKTVNKAYVSAATNKQAQKVTYATLSLAPIASEALAPSATTAPPSQQAPTTK